MSVRGSRIERKNEETTSLLYFVKLNTGNKSYQAAKYVLSYRGLSLKQDSEWIYKKKCFTF